MKTFFHLKTALLALALLSVAFTSCKKDDKDNEPDKTSLLTDKSWKMTAATVDPAIDWFGSGTKVTNVYAQFPACVKDDLVIFKKNGTVNFDEGATKCEPNDAQTVNALWSLNPAETIISITQTGETESWKILELTNSKLVVEYEEYDEFEGITYTVTITNVKQ